MNDNPKNPTIPFRFEIARNQGTVQTFGYYTLLVNLSIRSIYIAYLLAIIAITLSMRHKAKFIHNLQPIFISLFFLGIFVLYAHNLTRDVYSGDIGDLVTAGYVFGVAHPSGYPLFSLFGYIASHLPGTLPAVSKIGFISILSSLGALIFYYRFCREVTKSLFISLLSTSVLAFSYYFWLFTEMPEVFALNNFFIIVLLYFAIQFYTKKKISALYILAFLAGLSATHHQTIILIFPSILILIAKHIKIIFASPKRVISLIGLVLLGFSVYLYVPLAASKNPVMNWDNATSLKNFLHLLLRKDYGIAPKVVNEVPISIKLILVKDYFTTLFDSYSYQICFIGLLGILFLGKKQKWLLASLLVGFILSGPFFIYYAAPFITTTTAWGITERFYIFSYVIFMFFVPFGFLLLKNSIERFFPKKMYSTILLGYFLIVPLFLIIYNFPKTDLSKTHIGNTLAMDIISPLRHKSVLYVSGDTTAFNIWYVHYVLNKRKDIDIINPPGVASNYFLDNEINKYHEKNPTVPMSRVLHKTLQQIQTQRRIFSSYDIGTPVEGSYLLPKGLIYELIDKKNIPSKNTYLQETNTLLQKMHPAKRKDLAPYENNTVTPEIPMIYANAYVRVGNFIESYYNDPKIALEFYKKALDIDYENSSAYSGIALSSYRAFGDCTTAILMMKKAIENYKIWKSYYAQLFELYNRCKTNELTKNQLKTQYYSYFKEDIEDNPIFKARIKKSDKK